MSHIRFERTLGDGNCGPNAFVLGLSQPHVLNNIPTPPDHFIAMATAALSLPAGSDWNAVKTEILRLRESDKYGLQRTLAPVMRTLAMQLVAVDPNHQQGRVVHVQAAFQDFALEQLGLRHPDAGVPDDTFQHPAFREQFFVCLLEIIKTPRNQPLIAEYTALIAIPEADRTPAQKERLYGKNGLHDVFCTTLWNLQNTPSWPLIISKYKQLLVKRGRTGLENAQLQALAAELSSALELLEVEEGSSSSAEVIARYSALIDTPHRSDAETAELAALDAQLMGALSQVTESRCWKPLLEQLVNNIAHRHVAPWWMGNGHVAYTQIMSQPGKWFNDFDLAKLPEYFQVNLLLVKNSVPNVLHLHRGYLPVENLGEDEEYTYRRLTPAQIKQLVDRRIIDRPQADATSLKLLPLSLEELTRRLSPVDEVGEVQHYLQTLAPAFNLSGQPVPNAWSAACKRELRKRDMVRTRDGQMVFTVSIAEALLRVDAVWPGDDNHIQANFERKWNKTYLHHAPVVELHHSHSHWQNVRPQGYNEAPHKQAIERFFKPRNQKRQALEAAWQDLLRRATEASPTGRTVGLPALAAIHPDAPIVYCLPNDNGTVVGVDPTVVRAHAGASYITVTKETQIALDLALAAKLGREELDNSRCFVRRWIGC